jgi:phosphohistidine phosphatase
MRLYIVRHGIAIDREDPECPAEADRFLTREGVKKTTRAARGLAALGVGAANWYSSPWLRARQTADIVADTLTGGAAAIRETETLLPGADPAAFLALLRKDKAATAVAFGHAPHVDALIAALLDKTSPVTALKKAGAACLDAASLRPPYAALVWLMTPSALAELGRRSS